MSGTSGDHPVELRSAGEGFSAALAATLAACASRVTTRVYGSSYLALPTESEVRLSSVRVPECPFEEIALVSVFPQPRMLIRAPRREVFQALQRRARELGKTRWSA